MRGIKSKFINFICVLFVVCLINPIEVWAKADSYTDAKLFYETVDDKYHVDFAEMGIYYATKAKPSTTKAYKRYTTLAWQITMSANGESISVDVKRNGLYLEDVCGDQKSSDGYIYNLYKIDYNKLCELAHNKDAETWKKMETASLISIRLDAIITWIEPNKNDPVGYVKAEHNNGTLTYNDRSKVWYMGNETDRQKALDTFTSRFEGYYGLEKNVKNNSLDITYHAGYSDVTSSTFFTIDPSTTLIYKGAESKYPIKRFEMNTLMHPESHFGLKKTGYKIVEGKEWKYPDSTRYFDASKTYTATMINEKAATKIR